jgi:cation-transporting P-type ATPase 13A2
VVIWIENSYKLYASMIVFFSLVSIIAALIEVKENYHRLREMLFSEQTVEVLRNNNVITINSRELIPGDIVQLKENSRLTCDLILIKGNCVVEEAVITGESAPISKEELSNNDEIFENKLHNPYYITGLFV